MPSGITPGCGSGVVFQQPARAKIFERYASTLRHLSRYRGSDGRGYDSIVIVAHSLGTVISADLLRFLLANDDPELHALGFGEEGNLRPADAKSNRIPIKMLTMGSPIRQLLNRFFPHLYDWVRPKPDNGLRPLAAAAGASPPPSIAEFAPPSPEGLGVTEWVNMYRSGDYVGRSLWLDEWYNRTAGGADGGEYPETAYASVIQGRTEMCIGAGAHTHYWDDTAPEVANMLDKMI